MRRCILFWSERFWPTIGGVETSASKLLPALRARGYEFVVVTLADYFDLPEEDDYEGIPVRRFPFWSALAKGDVIQIAELRQRMSALKRTFGPELIHVNFLGPSVLFHLHTLDAHPAPLLVSMDSAFPGQEIGGDSLAGRILRSADWVTCVSAASLAQARKLAPEITPRSSFIYQGVKVPDLQPEPLPTESPRLLCLGRLDGVKGFDLALAAFASIAARFPRARLVIAGDGPERPELERQAAELGLGDAVEFSGWAAPDAVPALINSATVVVMPSRSESFGLVALEAAMMARPVVATRVGGLVEIVVHQQTGLLVEPEDSSALAEAIASLLNHPQTATHMGKAARQRAQEVFSWDRYVEAYDTLYQRLIEGIAPHLNVIIRKTV